MASEEVVVESAQEPPRNIMKFLCSYGGKILPKPFDGNLKYVGGDIRVVAVPRDITFSELMKRLSSFINGGDMVLKYQIIPEDLDELVTVKTDEDLKHMREELDRHESQGIPKLRTFLFPLHPATLFENQAGASIDPRTAEQQYIDAINGASRALTGSRVQPAAANRPSFSISACSSPRSNSPIRNIRDGEAVFSNGYQPVKKVSSSMQRVKSSPSIYSLGSQSHQHYYQNHSLHQPAGYGSFRPSPSPDYSRQGDSFSGRVPLGHDQNNYHPSNRRDSDGGRAGFYEDVSGHGNSAIDRSSRIPRSPRRNGLRQ